MESIKPAYFQNNIAVCFSVNDKYMPMFAVALKSIIEHSSPENNYDVVILMTEISNENQMKIFSMISNYPNFSVRFVNVGPYIYGYDFFLESDPTNTKYSNEIYFRFLVPTIFEDYDKVLFLDSDLIVLSNIAALFNIDISGKLVGAVRDFEGIANCYDHNYTRTKYRISELGITNFEEYFSSGVIIMNVQKFKETFADQNLIDIAKMKNWPQFDQDVLNYLCKNNVKIIDATWNLLEDIDGTYNSMPEKLYNEYKKSENNPSIVHFGGSRKPWLNKNSKYSKLYFELLSQTPFDGEINE